MGIILKEVNMMNKGYGTGRDGSFRPS